MDLQENSFDYCSSRATGGKSPKSAQEKQWKDAETSEERTTYERKVGANQSWGGAQSRLQPLQGQDGHSSASCLCTLVKKCKDKKRNDQSGLAVAVVQIKNHPSLIVTLCNQEFLFLI